MGIARPRQHRGKKFYILSTRPMRTLQLLHYSANWLDEGASKPSTSFKAWAVFGHTRSRPGSVCLAALLSLVSGGLR